MTVNPIPADLVAERQVLAIVLSHECPEPITAKFLLVPPDAWHDPVHDVVATVLRDRITRRIPIDPLVVATDAASVVGTDHKAQRVHRFVTDAVTATPPWVSFDYYAEEVLRALYLRRVHQSGQRLAQLAEHGAHAADIGDVLTSLRSCVDEIESGYGLAEPDKPMSLADLAAMAEEPHDWLVPDLLERTDRLVLTGFEGTGKTELVAQLGMALASGLHPFTGQINNEKGARVLLLDCENSRRQVRRRWVRLRDRVDLVRSMADADPIDWADQVRMVIRPEGVDLANPTELARVEQAIALTAPDLVVGGPLYKMSKLDIRDEPAAKALVDAFDHLRVKYSFGLVIEAHVGHGGELTGGRKLRPTGSSLLLRWPEFGLGLRAHREAANREHPDLVEFVSWRGGREVRDFPTLLGHSTRELPWTPRDPDYRYRNGMPAWTPEQPDWSRSP
ncbi:AAA family ATPase [Lentzea sp. JNUCC 0626]|uniref:AAA family ATPase n=1 Tax=Lentzea sp. JNUCC 0626 TaxID=3367513 RepID=UPI0037496741